MYVCMFVHICMYIFVCMIVFMNVQMYVDLSRLSNIKPIYITYVCMYVCMYLCVCMSSSTTSHPDLAAVESASGETAMILAACHSLVVVEEDDVAEDRAANLVGRLGWCSYWCWCCMYVCMYVCLLDLFLYDQCSYEPD